MDDAGVELSIATGPHVATAYPVVHLEPEGVRVRVPAGRERPSPDAEVEVRLRDPLTRERLILPGVVARSGGGEAEIRFVEPLAPDLAERRSAVRVQPRPGSGVEVHLLGDTLVEVDLVDLGATGLCVEQPSWLDAERVEVQLLLPGRTWPLLLAARRVHARQVAPRRSRCGYAFDPERTVAADVQLGSLSGWIASFAAALAGCLVSAPSPRARG